MEGFQTTTHFAPEGQEPQHAEVIRLAKYREAIVEQLKACEEQLATALTALGAGNYVQDPETKVVYKAVIPTGRYVVFKTIDYVRTRKSLDEKADLSMSEAQEAGFDLGALGPKKKG